MKQQFLLLLLSLCFTSLSAQSWAPPGAKWHYNLTYFGPPDIDFNSYTVVSDTTINGILCSRLDRFTFSCNQRPLTEYMYGDSGRVFYFHPTSNDFKMLYDFNVPAGGSYAVPIVYDNSPLPYDSMFVQVDSTYSLTINGQARNVQVARVTYSFSGPFVYNHEIIEGIGSTTSMFHWNSGICDVQYNMGLRCYEDSILGFYSTGIADSCEARIVNVSDPLIQSWLVYPNPLEAHATLRWQFPETGIYTSKIRDVQGRILVVQSSSLQEISFKDLAPGVYFIEIRSPQNQTHFQKILKRE